jgi:hypothetical protein
LRLLCWFVYFGSGGGSDWFNVACCWPNLENLEAVDGVIGSSEADKGIKFDEDLNVLIT